MRGYLQRICARSGLRQHHPGVSSWSTASVTGTDATAPPALPTAGRTNQFTSLGFGGSDSDQGTVSIAEGGAAEAVQAEPPDTDPWAVTDDAVRAVAPKVHEAAPFPLSGTASAETVHTSPSEHADGNQIPPQSTPALEPSESREVTERASAGPVPPPAVSAAPEVVAPAPHDLDDLEDIIAAALAGEMHDRTGEGFTAPARETVTPAEGRLDGGPTLWQDHRILEASPTTAYPAAGHAPRDTEHSAGAMTEVHIGSIEVDVRTPVAQAPSTPQSSSSPVVNRTQRVVRDGSAARSRYRFGLRQL